jgi:gliding motility-associated-like protein
MHQISPHLRIGKTNLPMKKSLILLILFLAGVYQLVAQNLRVSGSNGHSVIICSNGNVFAWGSNAEGQLGLNSALGAYPGQSYTTPQRVYGLGEIFQIDAGSGGHNLGLTCDGKVYAWGRGDYGQLGNGVKPVKQSAPSLVKGIGGIGDLSGVSYVSGGNDESFAILATKELVSWGQNDKGQLGTGNKIESLYPTYVLTAANTRLKNVTMVEAGDENGYALVDPDGDGVGTVYSWGDEDDNNGLALGRPKGNSAYAQPVQKEGGGNLDNIIAISAGDRHCLAIDSDGYLWAWGGDWGHGQVGDGYNTGGYYSQPFATKVVAGQLATTAANWKKEYLGGPSNPVVSIAAGQAHSAAVLKDGTIVSWGSNGFFNCGNSCSTPSGQLGVGKDPAIDTHAEYSVETAKNTAPLIGLTAANTPLKNVAEVSDGDAWTFAITKDGKIYVAGTNQKGELGLNNTTDQWYFTELDIPNCGVTPPCPDPKLPEDFKACVGFTQLLSAGEVYPGFEARFYLDGVLQYSEKNQNPIDGGKAKEITFTADTFGVWKVEVEDLRAATDRPCAPCALAKDSVEIKFNQPDFFDNGKVKYCGTSVINAQIGTTLPKNKDNVYVWYDSQTSTKILGRHKGSDSTTFDFVFNNTLKTPTLLLPDSSIILWVADSTLYKGTTFKKAESCDPTFLKGSVNYTPNSSSVNPNNQQRFVAYNPITLTELKITYQIQVYDAGKTLSGSLNFGVYRAKLDNQGNPIADQASPLATIQVPVTYTNNGTQDFTGEATVKLNVPIPGTPAGYYFFLSPAPVGVTNWGGNTTNGAIKLGLADCQSGQSVPKIDDLTGKILLFNGMSQNFQNNQTGQNIKGGHFYDVKFEKRAEYVCGRIPVIVKKSCPPCALATKLVVKFGTDTAASILTSTLPDSVKHNKSKTINVCKTAGSIKLDLSANWPTLDTKATNPYFRFVILGPKADTILDTKNTINGKVAPNLNGATSTTTLANIGTKKTSGTYTVMVMNTLKCVLSQTFKIQVDSVPLAAIKVVDSNYCAGQAGIKLEEANSPNVSSTVKYAWFSTATPNTIIDNTQFPTAPFTKGQYRVTVINGKCTTTSAPRTIFENPRPVFTSITSDKAKYCVGDEVTLTAAHDSLKFTWSTDGGLTYPTTNVGATYKFTATAATNPVNGYAYFVRAVNKKGCVRDSSIKVFINPKPAKPTASNNGPKCSGDTVTIKLSTPAVTNAKYKWVGPTGAVFNNDSLREPTLSAPVVAGDYAVHVISAAGCKSDTVRTKVIINQTPAKPIVAGKDSVCPGETNVAYNVTNHTAGATYTWSVVGTGSSTDNSITKDVKVNFGSNTTTAPILHKIKVTANVNGCKSDSAFNVGVKNNNPVSVVLSPKTKDICIGEPVEFTATPTNGGKNPKYKWYVNGAVQASTTDKFNTTTLTNNAVVKVELTSDISCPTGNPAKDSTTRITVVDKIVTKASIAKPDTVCINADVNIKGTYDGLPGTFQWYVNNVADPDNTGSDFSSTKVKNGDKIHVVLTSTSTCVEETDKVRTSNEVVVATTDSASTPVFSGPAIHKTCGDCYVLNYTPAAGLVGKKTFDATNLSPKKITDNNDGTVEICGLSSDPSKNVSRVTLTIVNGKCPAKTAVVDVNRLSDLPAINAGVNDTICSSLSTIDLIGTVSRPLNSDETLTWSASPALTITYPDNSRDGRKNAKASGYNANSAATYDFTLKIENPLCSLTSVKKVVIHQDFPKPEFNPDTFRTCAADYELAPLAPVVTIGTGDWVTAYGAGTFNPSTDKVTFNTVPANTEKTVYVVWQQENGKCGKKSDTLTFIKNGSLTTPVISLDNAVVTGKTVSLCRNKEYDLSVNGPDLSKDEEGVWSINGSSVTFTNFNDLLVHLNENNMVKTNPASSVVTYEISNPVLVNCAPVSRQVTLVIDDVPATPAVVTGNDVVCEKSTNELYQISVPEANTTYKWSGTDGIQFITDLSYSYVGVNFIKEITTATSETLTVYAENSCGTSLLPRTYPITVNPNVTPEVGITVADNAICAFEDGVFQIDPATLKNEGPNYNVQWFLNDLPINPDGNGPDVTLSGLHTNDKVYVKLYSTETCLEPTALDEYGGRISNSIVMTVTPEPVVNITTDSDPRNEACEGADVLFTAVMGQGTGYDPTKLKYTWFRGSDEFPGTSPTFGAFNDVTDGEVFKVVVETGHECERVPATDQLTMKIIPNVDVEAPLLPNVLEVCEGNPLPAYIADGPGHGDAAHPATYIWYINDVQYGVGKNSPTPVLEDGVYTLEYLVNSGFKCTNPLNGEVRSTKLTLTVNNTPQVSINGWNKICTGTGPNGETDLEAIPNEPGYTYEWTRDNSPIGNSAVITADAAGEYVVKVTTDKGCPGLNLGKQTVSEFEFDPIIISSTRTDFIKCVGDAIKLNVNAQSDKGVIYSWTVNSTALTNEDDNGVIAADSGHYVVELTKNLPGGLVCNTSKEQVVKDTLRPAPYFAAVDSILCEFMKYEFYIADSNRAPFNDRYTIYIDGIPAQEQSNPVTATKTGIYTVIADNSYCTTESAPLSLVFEKYPLADAGPDVYIVQGESAPLIGGYDQNAKYYSWYSFNYKADSLIVQPNEEVPVAVVNYLEKTTPFHLTVYSPSGLCYKTDSMLVVVERPIRPWNSFSPNGDGTYETWIIDRIDEFPNALVEVYNRWGNLVWMTKGYNNGDPKRSWNGSNFRNGEKLPVATYYYIIYPNGGKVNDPVTGHVTIVK